MKLSKQIKLRAKKIKKEEQEKYNERSSKLDQKVEQIGQTAKLKNKTANQRLIEKIKGGALIRGFWWFVQFWIEVSIIMLTCQVSAQTILPRLGLILGHASGLTTKADIIDKVNIMFIPTAFIGLIMVFGCLYLYKISWKYLTKWFDKLRLKTKKSK